MASQNSRGNYYKNKTKEYFEKLGYETQLTEFITSRPIGGGKVIYVKKDVFSSDGISMNGADIIFWNSKHCTTDDKNNIDTQIRKAKKEFFSHKFPPSVKLAIVMWEPRVKLPVVTYLNTL